MAVANEQLNNIPLAPAPPENLYFDEARKAWIASRYCDVLAALRSMNLSQTGPPTPANDPSVRRDGEKMRPQILSAVAGSNTPEWQTQISGFASATLRSLHPHRSFDLVEHFIRPWCLASAVALTNIDPSHGVVLGNLVNSLSKADAAPENVDLKCRASEAKEELDRFFQVHKTPQLKSLFVGIAQTTPVFLASACAALLQHPAATRQLQCQWDRLPKAIEELLRYAGPVHSLFRRADRAMDIQGTKVGCGDRLILRLASANRDPQQFPRPDRLDFARDVARHVALSSGSHYCAGGSLVRMMTKTAIQQILGAYSEPRLSSPVEWCCGTMLIWPSSLRVVLGNAH